MTKTAQKLADGHGLILEVRPSGAKLWRYRYRIAGKENTFAVGEYVQPPKGETKTQAEVRRNSGRLTLAEARQQRDVWRDMVKQGIHPSHHRQAERLATLTENATTFEGVAWEWISKKKPGWTPYYANQVEEMLTADVFPFVGSLPIRDVKPFHLLEIVQRVEGRGAPSVALLIRQWASAIFRYAVATLRADSDPATVLRGSIHRPKVKHHRPLKPAEIGDFLKALDTYGGNRSTVIALRLMLLTFVRTVELRKAHWNEMDLDLALWRIPAERMKMRELHLVPLSRQAVALLRELQTHTGGQTFLFPNRRKPKACMAVTTLNRALEYMAFNGKDGIGFSAHGFRATASTILNEQRFRPAVIERQLAHAERNKSRASYNQAEYLDERSTMMQAWADYLDTLRSDPRKVVSLRRSKRTG